MLLFRYFPNYSRVQYASFGTLFKLLLREICRLFALRGVKKTHLPNYAQVTGNAVILVSPVLKTLCVKSHVLYVQNPQSNPNLPKYMKM